LLVSAALVSFGYFRSGLMTLIGYEPLHVVALDLALGFLALWPLLWLCGLHARRATVTSAKIVALLTAVYFAAAWCLWAVNLIVDRDDGAYAAVYSLLIVLVVPFADRLLTLGLERWFAVKSGDDAERRSAADHRYWGRMVGRVAFAVAALLALSRAWGFGAGTALDHPIGLAIARSLFNIAVTLALAYVGWELVKHMINRKLAAERPANVGDGEIEGAGSRAHTLLPLLQSFVFIVMSVMVALIVLSSLGIDIGPLLAGAGIVGLAIGFGAQTLVRDVVSGVFFLIDDAFRIGEYVDLGRLRGTVEKISIRSLQLRHHRGAVHTVPFGQIQAITNQTRDWTIDKLELPLTLDADIDKVKKVLKRIGQEMMDNPELKDVLLEPLKSQGVSRMTDYGLIVRAKYKTVPSKQFLVRREAYKRIRDAFAAEGIKFAQPTVKVDGGDTDAAAAARAVLAKAADGA
jgi:small-conductance mechanosensitive channel